MTPASSYPSLIEALGVQRSVLRRSRFEGVVLRKVDKFWSPHLFVEVELFSPSVYVEPVIICLFNFIKRTTRSFIYRFYMLSRNFFTTFV